MKVRPAKKNFKSPHFSIPSPHPIVLAEGEPAPDKIQLFRCGTWEHPDYGTLEITPDVLSEFVENFRADVRGQDLPGDYSHESGKKAAAWIKDIFLLGEGEDTTLWSRVQWTPDGKKAVEDGDFRYTSPDFSFESQDTETGEWLGPTLNGFGLTNRPFIKRMAPIIQLHERQETREDDDDMATQMTLSEATKKISELEKKTVKLTEELSAATEKTKVCDDAGMTPEEMMAKISDLEAKLASTNSQLAEFRKKAGDATVQAAEAKKVAEFTVLLSEGKAVEAQRAAYLAGDTAEFVKLAQPVNLKQNGTGEGGGAGGAVDKDPQTEIRRLANIALSEKKAQDYAGAVGVVLKENPELKKRYYASEGMQPAVVRA